MFYLRPCLTKHFLCDSIVGVKFVTFACLLACFKVPGGGGSSVLGADEFPCPLPLQLYSVLIGIMAGILAQMVGKKRDLGVTAVTPHRTPC